MKKFFVLFILCLMFDQPTWATCTFSCGAGTGNSISQTSNTVPQNTNCTYSGYIFAGWSYRNTTYQPGETISSCLFGTRAYTAVWEAEPEPEPEPEPEIETSNIVTSKSYVDKIVNSKQQALSGDYNAVITYTDTAGTTAGRSIVQSLTAASTSSTTLPTSGAIVTGINQKQNKIPAANNRVITYTGTSGGLSSIGIYDDTGTYSGQTGTLAEVHHVNDAIVNGFDAHIVCDTYATPGDTTSECILWRINELSGTYVSENQ